MEILRCIGDEALLQNLVAGFPASLLLIILYSFRVFIFMGKDGQFRKWQGAWLLGVYLTYVVLQYALNVGCGAG